MMRRGIYLAKPLYLIFEYVSNANSSVAAIVGKFRDIDCRYYMFKFMVALYYAHSNGIMHRDVYR